jgi:hypothetical protein
MPGRHSESEFVERVVVGGPDWIALRAQQAHELRNWRELLTEKEQHDLDFAMLFTQYFEDWEEGLPHSKWLFLVVKLKDLLGSAVSFL